MVRSFSKRSSVSRHGSVVHRPSHRHIGKIHSELVVDKMKLTLSSMFSLLLVAGSLLSSASAAAILGVDMGSQFMKVALVQRGAPLEIVTNLHSKRKTEQMILFDQGTRFYGADANSLLARKPTKTPSGMSVMLGRDEEHPAVKVLSERHFTLTPQFNDTRSGLHLMVDGKESYTPEELVAMVMTHAEEMTVAYGKEKGHDLGSIRECSMTVPSFATQLERQAYIDAAELADFNVIGLIEENTAAALQFGLDKVLEDPKTYLFYNLGASSLQVSVVRFGSEEVPEGKFSKKTKKVGAIEVLGKAWDVTLGGQAFDNRLVDYMADHFNREWHKARGHDKDIRTIPRAMTKIRLQANKVKHVLSANQEIPIHMDSLHDDMSLSMHISRAQFEELCDDLMERAVAPVHKAIAMANLTLDDIDEIEMIGGGMRVPKVQADLSAALGGKELGMHLNSDESMALGAAFSGANYSTSFRVRQVNLVDYSFFPIKLSLADDAEPAEGEEPWTRETVIFPAPTKFGQKKSITFTHDTDVDCALDYAEPDDLPAGSQSALQRYRFTGIKEFAKQLEEKGLGKPKVSLQFQLKENGITAVTKAEASFEETITVQEEVEVDDDEEANNTDAESDNATEESLDDSESASDNSTKKKKTKIIEKEKKKLHKITVPYEVSYIGKVQPMSAAVREESKAKMAELARKDKERFMLEEARNKVESYSYLIKNKLMDYEEEVAKVSTEEQREEIRQLASDATDWLDFDAFDADLEAMEKKYKEISEPAEKIWFRMAEVTARPEAVAAMTSKLDKISKKLEEWKESMPQVTEEEHAEAAEKVEAVRTWIQTKVEEQESKEAHEDPAFTSEEVPLQSRALERLLVKLSKKPMPTTKKEEAATNDTTSDNSTEGENATSSEGDESEPKADSEQTSEEASEEPKEDEL
eukprot:Nitzschia sp. Nitz4//scaffold137_size62074//32198//35242//NITZ4_006418-RA/size62074-augustus-gene-0.70-mRNA-1//-1//CDS//3329535709//848//frame0